jgi:hypothetical protein
MRRREFILVIGGVAAIWPVAGFAQRSAKTWRVGHVFPGSPAMVDHFADVFEQRLMSHFRNRDASDAYFFAAILPKVVQVTKRSISGTSSRTA